MERAVILRLRLFPFAIPTSKPIDRDILPQMQIIFYLEVRKSGLAQLLLCNIMFALFKKFAITTPFTATFIISNRFS